METQKTKRLRNFFGLDHGEQECHFCLPVFKGQNTLDTTSQPYGLPEPRDAVQYPGRVFADRDARAAFYVTSIISPIVKSENIKWNEPDLGTFAKPGTLFLFGSRTNNALEWITEPASLGRFVRFEFGDEWSILANGKAFSLKAPVGLSREEYERETDYGVIGRLQSGDFRPHSFLIAGLGGRATEGCAYFLSQHWEKLAEKYEGRDFAIILSFRPPVSPTSAEVVAELTDYRL